MDKKRVLFFSGTRAEFDILYTFASDLNSKNLVDVIFVVGGGNVSGLQDGWQSTLKRDFQGKNKFKIIELAPSIVTRDDWKGRASAFSSLNNYLNQVFTEYSPDIVVVAGDREEALSATTLALLHNKSIIHLHGGDLAISSDIDEIIRPAISKMAHFHFVASSNHKERLIKMGEEKKRIFVVGSAGIDRFKNFRLKKNKNTVNKFLKNLDLKKPFFILIQHPSPNLEKDPEREMEVILRAIIDSKIQFICGYPNFDPGYLKMREVIEQFKNEYNFQTFENLPFDEYALLLNSASGILGNSSAINIESPFLAIPGVLIGDRQKYREKGENVIQISSDYNKIMSAIKKIQSKEFIKLASNCSSPYGDGNAVKKMITALKTILRLRKANKLKIMTY